MFDIIGIDNGNGNIKTRNVTFPCAFKVQDIKPSVIFTKDILEYNGKFYSLTQNRFSYQTDKTTNDNAFILSLFAIAKEIIARHSLGKADYDFKKDFSGYIGKDVVLAVGLPPAHIEKQSNTFKDYFLKRAEHGISFKYNDKPFNFYIRDVKVYPQDYAGAIIFRSELISEYSTCYCIDIGDGTIDMVGLVDGVPDKDSIVSREFGMSKLRSIIIDDAISNYGVTLSDKNVEDFLMGKKIALAEDLKGPILECIDNASKAFTTEIINQLHSKVPDFRTYPTIFSGGGAIALKKYLLNSKAFGVTDFIEQINSNAVGYEKIAELSLKTA